MKGSLGKFLRSAAVPLVGLLASGTLVGCGDDKKSDPDAVKVEDLKYPQSLSIMDNGNGSVTLSWVGSNNEDKFDGYNVYGLKLDAPAAAGAGKVGDLSEGNALELLDDEGEPVQAAKDTLAKFNYDPDKGLGLAKDNEKAHLADSTSTGTSKDEEKFSALPIHTKSADGKDQNLPTCKPRGGECKMTTDGDDKDVSDDQTLRVNGPVKMTLDKLTVGQTYCFIVMSSIGQGENVSQTSSNLACVTPKFSSSFKLPLPAATTDNTKFDIGTWLTACKTAKTCADPTTGTSAFVDDGSTHKPGDAGPIYVEYGSSGPGLVAGKNSAIQDVGYYASLADAPRVAPTLVLDTTVMAAGNNKDTPVLNGGGYSSAGQTVPLLANHVYVLAIGDATATSAQTKFHYHWLFVKAAPTGASVDVQMMLDANQQ